jgi:hypothetical protein
MQVWAAAAVVAALAVGVWIGRAVLPGPAPQLIPTPVQSASNTNAQGGWSAEYVKDAKYQRQREQLVRGLEARLAALPPESRARVLSSLKAIEDSKKQLEEALGKDPSNALLQELLVNTYQDEMRLLTTVHEVDTGEGI